MTRPCLYDLCAHAEIQAAEDFSIETMLELLPGDVGYAVAHSFRHRYSLSSPGLAASGVASAIHDFSTTLQPLVLLIAFDSTLKS